MSYCNQEQGGEPRKGTAVPGEDMRTVASYRERVAGMEEFRSRRGGCELDGWDLPTATHGD